MSTRKAAPRQAAKALAELAEKIEEEGMSTTKANPRKALAEFAGNVEKGGGWWFRLPEGPGVGDQDVPNDSVHPDGIMPQLGVLFSLDESTMLSVLRHMGCYTKKGMKGQAFPINKNGWENLVSEFKIPPTSLVIASFKTFPGGFSGSHYVKIGNVSMAPLKIYAKFKANPKEYHAPSVSTQQSRDLVAESMVKFKIEADAAAVIAAPALAEKEKAEEAARIAANTLAEKQKAKEVAAAAISDPGKQMFRDDFSEGTAADYSSPVLQHFGVPIDNQKTLTRLHLEVTKALLACQRASAGAGAATPPTGEKVIKKVVFGKLLYTKIRMALTHYQHYGSKRSVNSYDCQTKEDFTAMTEYCIQPKGKEDEEAQTCIRQVIGEFEKSYPVEFLKVCVSKGLSTSKCGKMPAQFWNAMADDANLQVTQQRIVNRYLTHHFGAGVRVSETELRQNIQMDNPEIRKEQAAVAKGSKRNLKRNLPNSFVTTLRKSQGRESIMSSAQD
jgi:hypothetical protein